MKSNRDTIRYMHEKLKSFLENDRAFTVTLVLVVAVGAFFLGRLSVVPYSLGTSGSGSVAMTYTAPSPQISAENDQSSTTAPTPVAVPVLSGDGEVVASKSAQNTTCRIVREPSKLKPKTCYAFRLERLRRRRGIPPPPTVKDYNLVYFHAYPWFTPATRCSTLVCPRW